MHEFSTQQASHVKENALAMLHKTDHLPRIFSTIECLMGGAVVILGVSCSNDAALKMICIKTNSLGQKSGNPIERAVRLSFSCCLP